MQIKTHKTQEQCPSKIVKRTVLFEGIIHDDGTSELRIEISDEGEHDKILSALIIDKTEMKKLRAALSFAINEKTYR